MVFDIKNKVAIVTGGASGIGLSYTKELLRNGAKGVTIADINQTLGNIVVKDLEKQFGTNKVIFVSTDVSDKKQLEDTFIKTINKFQHVDIVINNAGIGDDSRWEKEIAINLNGVIYGILLGMEKYLPKFKQGDEGVILNTASTAAIDIYSCLPVYSATKHGVVGLTKCWGTPDHYEETKVRILALCPGPTKTPITENISNRGLGQRYTTAMENLLKSVEFQEPDFLAKEAMKIIMYAKNGSVWVIDESQPCYEYIVPSRTTMKKNVLQCT